VLSPRHHRIPTAALASTLAAGLLAFSVGPAAGRTMARANVEATSQPAARNTVLTAGAPASALTASALTDSALTASPHERAAPLAVTADDGAAISGSVWKDGRMLDIVVKSPSVGSAVPVRLLLPPDWSDTANRTWPVLFLLQGAHDDYTSWTRGTSIEAFSADKDMIVAMPGSGATGLPTRWWNDGRNSPDYESFQVTELMQLLQRGFRASTVRAVAGVSTGGYGALMMAAHHPGDFTAAASYSGIVDTTYPGMPDVIGAIVAREFQAPDSLWGDPVQNESLWSVDNPYSQATRLRFTSLFISCGSGENAGSGAAVGGILESALWQQSLAFTKRLSLLGIPAQTDLYGGGVHDWSAWDGEFNKSWPMLSASLGLS
jgi:diacylglycerol O-acyltransferase / trehalose O-mycolyltransferase